MRRRVIHVKNAVLHHLVVPGLILLIGIGGALAQSGDLRAQDQSTKGPAANSAPSAEAAKETQRKTDECTIFETQGIPVLNAILTRAQQPGR